MSPSTLGKGRPAAEAIPLTALGVAGEPLAGGCVTNAGSVSRRPSPIPIPTDRPASRPIRGGSREVVFRCSAPFSSANG